MAYCTQEDIEKQVSADALVQLTDDLDTGAVDSGILTAAIADADAEIDGYCQGRYSIPFSPVPPIIKKLSVDIAIYNLMSRRVHSVTEERQQRYDNAVRFLRDIARGVGSLGDPATSEVSGGAIRATTTRGDRAFTMGRTSDSSTGTLDNY